jgi:hypothetical protein
VKADLHLHAELLAERTKVTKLLAIVLEFLSRQVALLLGWFGHLNT